MNWLKFIQDVTKQHRAFEKQFEDLQRMAPLPMEIADSPASQAIESMRDQQAVVDSCSTMRAIAASTERRRETEDSVFSREYGLVPAAYNDTVKRMHAHKAKKEQEDREFKQKSLELQKGQLEWTKCTARIAVAALLLSVVSIVVSIAVALFK